MTNVVVGGNSTIAVSAKTLNGGISVSTGPTVTKNVLVARKRTVQISANATAGIIDTTNPVVLKQIPVLTGAGTTRLDDLTDVVASNEVDGATLVYNSVNDTYVVQKLDLANVTGDLDGGTF